METNLQPSGNTQEDRNLMVVLNVGEEDSICESFLPYWKLSGYEVGFSSPHDKPSRFGPFKCGRSYDRDNPKTWHFYQRRFLETMQLCLETSCTAFCFTQYDSVCFGPLPVPQTDECIVHIAGGEIDGLGRYFVHPPWIFGRCALEKFVTEAARHPLDMCKGVMDFWMAAIIELAKLKIKDSSGVFNASVSDDCTIKLQCRTGTGWSWSANSIDTPEKIHAAKIFRRSGGLFIHGVKNQSILNKILE